MEGLWETVAKWAASSSGSAMLMGAASTTMGILLATFIRTRIWPLTILLAKCVLKLSCALASLVGKLVLKHIFQHSVPVSAAATNGVEKDVESHEHDGGKAGGKAPCKVQADDV